MAATRTDERRGIRVCRNHIGEVFITDIQTGVEMRIDHSPYGGLQFTTSGRVEPVQITNMIGWRIYYDRAR